MRKNNKRIFSLQFNFCTSDSAQKVFNKILCKSDLIAHPPTNTYCEIKFYAGLFFGTTNFLKLWIIFREKRDKFSETNYALKHKQKRYIERDQKYHKQRNLHVCCFFFVDAQKQKNFPSCFYNSLHPINLLFGMKTGSSFHLTF